MPKVVVIGCGVLGRRHLEALFDSETPLAIWGVDPSEEALSLASKRFFISEKRDLHDLYLSTDFDDLPTKVDIVISATDAGSRLEALTMLFNRVEVEHLILEKVLFSRLADFDKAEKLFEGRCSNIWVNCPRRANATYAEIKARVGNADAININVRGGNWSLASNSIHFIDLYAFLSGCRLMEVDASNLEACIYPSKRPGFIELNGIIECNFSSGQLSLSADINGRLEAEIEIVADDLIIKINELEGTVKFASESLRSTTRGSIKLAPQSRLTTEYVAELLSSGELPLTRYEESAALHKPFLKACSAHQARVSGKEVVDCKIT